MKDTKQSVQINELRQWSPKKGDKTMESEKMRQDKEKTNWHRDIVRKEKFDLKLMLLCVINTVQSTIS